MGMVACINERGARSIATPAERIQYADGGGVTRGMVDLAGLPPGDYRLEVVAAGADSVVRTAAFRMAGFETEAAIADATPAQDGFAGMSGASLHTLFLALV